MNDFYRSYLDADPHREGTQCIKWDGRGNTFGCSSVIPMWVADMDFRTVPAVTEALVQRAAHGIYGYTMADSHNAEANWLKRRHGLTVDPEWILHSPGVVDSIAFFAQAFMHEKDRILIQPPVYGPFFSVPKQQGCAVRCNALKRTATGWEMDYEDMEKAFRDEGVGFMLLCNPHNPVGRVWTAKELSRALEIANKYNVLVLCDEIHAEFTFEQSLCNIYSLAGTDNVVVLTSATKAFNLAGLHHSSIIVKNPALREKLQATINKNHAGSPNIFGDLATRVAYECGDEWMDAVLEYIRENRDIAVEYIASNIPAISTYPQEGTYLMWLDCSAMGLSGKELSKRFVEAGGVGLTEGSFFGEEGNTFMRLNIATQRKNLMLALEGLRKAATI